VIISVYLTVSLSSPASPSPTSLHFTYTPDRRSFRSHRNRARGAPNFSLRATEEARRIDTELQKRVKERERARKVGQEQEQEEQGGDKGEGVGGDDATHDTGEDGSAVAEEKANDEVDTQ
jgi:hypothetical protein